MFSVMLQERNAVSTSATHVAIGLGIIRFVVIGFASDIVRNGDGKPDYKWLVTSTFRRLKFDYTL